MKRVLSILALCAMTACNVAEYDVPSNPATVVDPEGETLFHGTTLSVTKMAVGEIDGNHYKVLWEEGDVLTVTSAEDGTVLGEASIVSGAGSAEADFSMPGTIADSTRVVLVYKELSVPAEQTRSNAGDKNLIAAAVSDTVYIYKGQSQAFCMKHSEAVVKVSVSTDEEFEGASLSAVILRSEGPALSSEGDYVRVSLESPVTLSSSQETEIWFTSLPAESSSTPIYVAFEILSNGIPFTVPVAFDEVSLKAGCVNPFKVEGLKRYMNVPWFKSFDLREMPGIDYAYGDANCYFIQCKNGSTYTGAGYIPNDAIPDEVAVSYRARGDFRKVIIPKGVSFTWMKLGVTDPSTGTGTGNIYTMRTNGYSASGVDPTKFSFSVDTERYEVKVKNDGAYAGAPVLLMVKEGTILWAWSFWNIAADGTSIDPVLITNATGKQIITMDIGQATRNGAQWGANSDALYRTVYKYQWGRPIPILWNSVTTLDMPGIQDGNIPAVTGPLSLEESMKYPASLIVASSESGKSITDWLNASRGDLWGNNSTDLSTLGTKTVFDPCPKGYRVCDRFTLLNIVRNYATDWDIVSGDGYAFHSVTYPEGSDLWLRSGFWKATTGTSFEKTSVTGNAPGTGGTNGFWWTNLCQGDSDLYPSVYVAAGNKNLAFNDNWTACNKAFAASVRCEVDTTYR